ncbi:TPA: restriction endonuclease subunit S [Streptococcus suis]|nr:restriction endonuclease subunit S [Streptococcus suis]
MNQIEKMLQDYCPNGVEWKELGDREVAKLSRGKVMSKQFLEENKGVFPVYSSQTANSGEIGKISTFDFDGEYITWTTDGANAGTVFYRQGKFSITNVCGLVDIQNDKLLTKFVYYYLTITTKKYVSSGMGNPKLMSNVMAKIKIPIPPLEIQEEIVKILDKFTEYVTELTAELTAELTLRQKQYNYFRDYLLNFDSDSSGGANNKVYQVEWKTLGDIAKLKNGKDWKSLSVGDIPVYGSGGAMGEFVSEYAYNKPTVLIPRKGSISNLFYLEKPFWNVDTIYYTEIDESQVVPRYLYYYLTTIDLESMATNPTRPSLTQAILDKIPIPVPSLPIQQRIVQVLDNFDAVCNDLNIGLPKEIELRQKQYEYFREKLLTFTAEGVYPGQWTVSGDRPT